MTSTAAVVDNAEAEMIDDRLRTKLRITLAGDLGATRSLRSSEPSEPGWTRFRTGDELRSFHEASHAVIALLAGQNVYLLSIVGDEAKGFGGHCTHGQSDTATPEELAASLDQTESDLRYSCHLAYLIVGLRASTADERLKLAQAEFREAEQRVAALLEEHWITVQQLAAALVSEKNLDQQQVREIYRRFVKG